MDKVVILEGNEELEEFKELVLDDVVPFIGVDGFFEEVQNILATLVYAFFYCFTVLAVLADLQCLYQSLYHPQSRHLHPLNLYPWNLTKANTKYIREMSCLRPFTHYHMNNLFYYISQLYFNPCLYRIFFSCLYSYLHFLNNFLQWAHLPIQIYFPNTSLLCMLCHTILEWLVYHNNVIKKMIHTSL